MGKLLQFVGRAVSVSETDEVDKWQSFKQGWNDAARGQPLRDHLAMHPLDYRKGWRDGREFYADSI